MLILAAATAIKWTWALFSMGTCDAVFFFLFAKELTHASLAELYRTSDLFNHTPFTGYLMVGLLKLANGEYGTFAAYLRLLSILADISVVLGLVQMRRRFGTPPWWALALFAASPVSIMVSGFHGNVDPIMVAFLFLAGMAILYDQPIWSGVLFAAACNVKVVPLLIAPFFLLYWWNRDRRAAFGVSWPLRGR